MNWRTWFTGLANGVISGLASGVAANLAGATWKQIGIIAGTSAVVSAAKWIMQHPLPGAPE